MKLFFPILYASFYGLFIRLVFGFFADVMGVMSYGFLLVTPVIIGFLTVFLWPRDKVNSTSRAFFLPWLTCLLVLIVTIALNIEGAICWVMIFPFFAVVAGFGGIWAFRVRKPPADKELLKDIDDLGNKSELNFSLLLLLLPILISVLEGDRTLSLEEITVTESIVINSTPKNTWSQLINIDSIASQETQLGFSSIFGFPRHLNTVFTDPSVGAKRMANYEKGLTFEETVTQYEPNKSMTLAIKTDPSKISAKVMDEHIVIGGKYVDILEDSYKLESLQPGKCRLILSSRFSINTPINWYTKIWAKYLMSDILKSELRIVSERATR